MPKLDKDLLIHDEIQALISKCNPKCLTGLRNQILIALLAGTGLRISEALALKPKDLNEREGTVRVLHGKGDKERTVGAPADLFPRIELWLERRKKERRLNRSYPLFCTLKGKRLNDIYFRELLHRLAQKAGIQKRVHPHALRRSFASQLLTNGTVITDIQDALGHQHLGTTSVYVKNLNPKSAIEAAHSLPGFFKHHVEKNQKSS